MQQPWEIDMLNQRSPYDIGGIFAYTFPEPGDILKKN
jgi:hypothetical protein